jgi:hypothetical protein
MTRGSLYIIVPVKNSSQLKMLRTVEFNGEQYPDGYGDETLEGLREVKNQAGLKRLALKINEYYNYPEKEVNKLYPVSMDGKTLIDFNNKYFERFFSDWVFFKNLTEKEINFVTSGDNREVITAKPNETIRFSFGQVPTDSFEDKEIDRPELMTKTLKEIGIN